MTFEQVKEGLKQGKKYRRKCWIRPQDKIKIDSDSEFIHDSCGYPFRFTLEDFDADDWEEVEG